MNNLILTVILIILIALIIFILWWPQEQDSIVVALLELSGDGWVQHDRAVARYLRLKHPDVVIVDTNSQKNRTLELLMFYYSRGVRNFLGGSRSEILEFIRDSINQNDMIFASVGSTAIPLAKVDNIYRLVRPDSDLITLLPRFFKSINIDHVYFLTQIGDEWTISTTKNLTPALRRAGISTGVSYVNMNLSEEEISSQLNSEIPDNLSKNTIFMSFIAGNDNEKFYRAIDDSPKALSKDHYAGDATAFFEFSEDAKIQAEAVNLRAYSYIPDSTPESVRLTETVAKGLGYQPHPFSVISIDAVTSLKNNQGNYNQTLNQTYGVTGSLASDENGDRSTGQYIWFKLSNNWSPDIIMGKNLQYGEFTGEFVE